MSTRKAELIGRVVFNMFLIQIAGFSSYCQVVNDSIANRLKLSLNNPIASNTIGATVEWNCVDKALTGRCIKYHNDQWFFFEVLKKGDYYINISNQHCRDLNGVQAVVIEGMPCEVQTYKILTCYSEGKQDDIFIGLRNLEPLKQYLINIDGYLHDYCSFHIELSDTPKGLPIERKGNSKAEHYLARNNVVLQWEIPNDTSLTISEFQVWKRKPREAKHQLAAVIPVIRNALGNTVLSYEYHDSLFSESPSHYKILGISEKENILIDELLARKDSIEIDTSERNRLEVSLDYKPGTPLTILIFDARKQLLLQNIQLIFNKKNHKTVTYYVGHHRQKGIDQFRIEILNNKTKQRRVLNFD